MSACALPRQDASLKFSFLLLSRGRAHTSIMQLNLELMNGFLLDLVIVKLIIQLFLDGIEIGHDVVAIQLSLTVRHVSSIQLLLAVLGSKIGFMVALLLIRLSSLPLGQELGLCLALRRRLFHELLVVLLGFLFLVLGGNGFLLE